MVASKAELYQQQAVRCEKLAEKTAAPCARDGYRRSAKAWLKLAALYDERQEPHRPSIDLPDLD